MRKNEVYTYTKVIIVQNLNYSISEDDLRRFFNECGTITKIRIIHDKNDKPKGNAFVAFETHDMALEAISKDEKRLLDRYIYVELNKSPNIEEEMTQKQKPPIYYPMRGKPFSENPLILQAYELVKNKKKDEKKIEEAIQKVEVKEEVKKEIENPEPEIKDRHSKKHKKSSKDKSHHRHHHHSHHISKRHSYHRDDSDEYSDVIKIYYSEIPEIA